MPRLRNANMPDCPAWGAFARLARDSDRSRAIKGVANIEGAEIMTRVISPP